LLQRRVTCEPDFRGEFRQRGFCPAILGLLAEQLKDLSLLGGGEEEMLGHDIGSGFPISNMILSHRVVNQKCCHI
jgi:hypothetical protein